MKRNRRFMAIIAMLLCAVMIAGCAPSAEVLEQIGGEVPNQVKTDTNKVQLYVANYDGGMGHEWLNRIIAQFEEDFKDTEFVPGKKGVQVIVTNNKTDGKTWLDTMDNNINEVFFTEWLYYYDHVSQGKLLDITDIVTEDLSASTVLQDITGSTLDLGDTGSIADKLNEAQRTYYDVDGKYYALPHYVSTTGIIYDMDLFEEEKLYFAADRNNGNNGFIIREDDVRSNGPDGIAGTTDDGLPVTYEEFYALCDYMKEKSIIPLAWAVKDYISDMLQAMHAQNAGYEEFMLNYTFEGTAKSLLNDNLTPMGDTEITAKNGYMLARQKGLYGAIDFMYNIIDKEYYASQFCFSNAMTHLKMQEEFLKSRFSAKQDIAMVVEGNWWENEAAAVWKAMASTPGASKEERNIGFMPLPVMDESLANGERTILANGKYTGAFIKASIPEEKIPLAKLFLQYTSTESALQDFTVTVGQGRNFNYELTDEQYKGMTTFQKTIWDLKKNADVVYPYSDSKLYISYPSSFEPASFFKSSHLGISYVYPHMAFKNGISSGLDAKTYWSGHVDLSSRASWELNYSAALN